LGGAVLKQSDIFGGSHLGCAIVRAQMGAGGDSDWFLSIELFRPEFDTLEVLDDLELVDPDSAKPDDLSHVRVSLNEPGSVREVGAAPHVALIVADLPRTDAREYLL
jgi:hypothetical protein